MNGARLVGCNRPPPISVVSTLSFLELCTFVSVRVSEVEECAYPVPIIWLALSTQ